LIEGSLLNHWMRPACVSPQVISHFEKMCVEVSSVILLTPQRVYPFNKWTCSGSWSYVDWRRLQAAPTIDYVNPRQVALSRLRVCPG